MSQKLFLNRVKEEARAKRIHLVFIFIIVALISACAGEYKKQPTSNTHIITIQLSPENGSIKNRTSGDHEIICRTITPTGTLIKKTICTTKAQWDEAGQNGRALANEITRRSGINE